MEQVAKISGAIRSQNVNLAWDASLASLQVEDPDDCSKYSVKSWNANLQIGDSFKKEIDGRAFSFFLESVDEAMPRADADDPSGVDYVAQLDVDGEPLLVKAAGDGFVTMVAPNGVSSRFPVREFNSWANAVLSTLQALQRNLEAPYSGRIRRRR